MDVLSKFSSLAHGKQGSGHGSVLSVLFMSLLRWGVGCGVWVGVLMALSLISFLLPRFSYPGVLAAERTAGGKGVAPEERMKGRTDSRTETREIVQRGRQWNCAVGFKGDGIIVQGGACVLKGWQGQNPWILWN